MSADSAKFLNCSDNFSENIRSTACQLPPYSSFSSSQVVSVEEAVGILKEMCIGEGVMALRDFILV